MVRDLKCVVYITIVYHVTRAAYLCIIGIVLFIIHLEGSLGTELGGLHWEREAFVQGQIFSLPRPSKLLVLLQPFAFKIR